jgi:branched-chain amino acid transport system substrate-binding protein
MPESTIIGGRGPHGNFAPPSPLNDWFRKAYNDRFNTWPTYPSYKMAIALLGLKSAWDKAAKAAGGKATQEQVMAALAKSEFDSPSGKVQMSLAGGHQGVYGASYGLFSFDKSKNQATVTQVKNYPAACVNPPEGVKSSDWIKSGFKGAAC